VASYDIRQMVLVDMLVVALVLVGCVVVRAQPPQWYYTGNVRNDKTDTRRHSFQGETFDIVHNFFHKDTALAYLNHPEGAVNEDGVSNKPNPRTFLYFGGTAASLVSYNETIDNKTLEFIHKQLSSFAFSSSPVSSEEQAPAPLDIHVEYALYYDICALIDYGTLSTNKSDAVPTEQDTTSTSTETTDSNAEQTLYDRIFSVEVGMYDFQTETFSKQYWLKKKYGSIIAVVFDISSTGTEGATERHWMLVNVDQRGRRSVMLHTWQPLSNNSNQNDHPTQVAEGATTAVAHNLKVMTYNLWHNNPPSWVWRFYKERWEKYEARLMYVQYFSCTQTALSHS
jgi:hypothetical protein